MDRDENERYLRLQENFVCFLFVVFYNVVLFGMAIIDEGDFDLWKGIVIMY